MLLLTVFFSFVFIFIAFLSGQIPEEGTSPFFAYFYSVTYFISENYKVFILGFIIFVLYFVRYNRDRKFSVFKNCSLSILKVFFLTSIGFFTAYFFLFVIAFLQLNVIAFLFRVDPEIIGIQTDKKVIIKELKANYTFKPILVYEKEWKKVLSRVASTMSGTKNFYGGYIIPSLPEVFILTDEKLDPARMLFADNTLIIFEIRPSDIQQISPVVGNLFVRDYFPMRKIRSYPKVTIMSRADYSAYRRDDLAKKIAKIDDQLGKIENIMSSISARLRNEKNKNNRIIYETRLYKYKEYEDFYKTQIKRGETLEGKIPYELGVFNPPDSIRIVYVQGETMVADYFSTIVHEYFHYASYISEKKRLKDSFFEEGLTEYFTRSAIENNLQERAHLTYPVHVAVISEMMKIIPESEFAEIYFTKDEVGLEEALDRVYGDGFYKNNQVLFDALHYTTDPKQIKKLADDIMVLIGGSPLEEYDLEGRGRD